MTLKQPENLDIAARILSWQLDKATGTLGFHAERRALRKSIGDGLAICTNCRGFAAGQPLDGHLDGWHWKAWSGSFIVHGATEKHAVKRLEDLMCEEFLPVYVEALRAAGKSAGITDDDIVQEIWEDARFGRPTLEEATALVVAI